MSLPVAARATRCFPTFAVLQLVGNVLVVRDVSHKPLTLPQIKELLDDGDDVDILPLIHELYMKRLLKNMKCYSFFCPFRPKSKFANNSFLIVHMSLGYINFVIRAARAKLLHLWPE
jgi:hypothetical protein